MRGRCALLAVSAVCVCARDSNTSIENRVAFRDYEISVPTYHAGKSGMAQGEVFCGSRRRGRAARAAGAALPVALASPPGLAAALCRPLRVPPPLHGHQPAPRPGGLGRGGLRRAPRVGLRAPWGRVEPRSVAARCGRGGEAARLGGVPSVCLVGERRRSGGDGGSLRLGRGGEHSGDGFRLEPEPESAPDCPLAVPATAPVQTSEVVQLAKARCPPPPRRPPRGLASARGCRWLRSAPPTHRPGPPRASERHLSSGAECHHTGPPLDAAYLPYQEGGPLLQARMRLLPARLGVRLGLAVSAATHRYILQHIDVSNA